MSSIGSVKVDGALVSVVVVSYNHEQYIAECLEGILAQQGNFSIELVIGDDGSTDRTGDVIRAYAGRIPKGQYQVKVLPTDRHFGMVKNYKRCFEACTGEYVAVCEGDDYWTDKHKLQKQVQFLRLHPRCSMCFNDLTLLFQDTGEMMPAPVQQRLQADFLTARDLVLENSIWNFSCCMYDARYLRQLPEGIYDLAIADWMFNISYAQFGDIGHVKELMSVYRKHRSSAWSSKTPTTADSELYSYIDDYNKFLGYKYDAEFSKYQQDLEERGFLDLPSDLVVLDDTFPYYGARERYAEFMHYLQEFPSITIYSAAETGDNGLARQPNHLLADFKIGHPQYAACVRAFHARPHRHAKLVYCASLANANRFIQAVEHLGAPFVFSMVQEHNFASDLSQMEPILRRVFASPCFTAVIVPDLETHDAIAGRRLCWPEHILYISKTQTTIDYLKEGIRNAEIYRTAVSKRMQSPSQRLRALVKHPWLAWAAIVRRLKALVPPHVRRWMRLTMQHSAEYARAIRPLLIIWLRSKLHRFPDDAPPRAFRSVQRLLKSRDEQGRKSLNVTAVSKMHDTAVILHLFYVELWEEMAQYLQSLEGDFDLYISLPRGHESFQTVILSSYPEAHIFFFENRGRDTAPFLLIFRAIRRCQYKYILKIHAKKSAYREGGDRWRRGMLDGLLGSRHAVETAKAILSAESDIGMICPVGYRLTTSLYWSKAEIMTRSLGRMLGIKMERYPDFPFVAGTMFWARAAALDQLNGLALMLDDFHPEPINREGDLPHAIERLIGLVVTASGFRISEIDEAGNEVHTSGVARGEFFGL